MPRPTLNDDERAQRRSQLLAAAHHLYRERKALPTVAEIAQAAGVAKGTVYLSFGTKEEIFIALLEDSYAQLLQGALPVLQDLPPDPIDAAHLFATFYADALGALPDLLPLAAMTNSVLEKNLPLQAMLDFKLLVHQAMDQVGAAIEQRLPCLRPGGGSDLLMRTWALTLGLWQARDCPEPIVAHLAEHPEHPLARHLLGQDFADELAATVRQFWVGALLDAQAAQITATPRARAKKRPAR